MFYLHPFMLRGGPCADFELEGKKKNTRSNKSPKRCELSSSGRRTRFIVQHTCQWCIFLKAFGEDLYKQESKNLAAQAFPRLWHVPPSAAAASKEGEKCPHEQLPGAEEGHDRKSRPVIAASTEKIEPNTDPKYLHCPCLWPRCA